MSASTLAVLEDFLVKARRRLSDEEPDYSDRDEEQDDEGLDSFEDENSGGDEADDWLRANDPSLAGQGSAREEVDDEPPSDYDESPQKSVASVAPAVRRPEARAVAAQSAAPQTQRVPKRVVMPSQGSTDDPRESNDMQPTREELARLRDYTRAWSSRARDKSRLEAEAHKNPVRHHEGRLIEARKLSHADYQRDYDQFLQSPEFQNADPFTQMDMETQFKADWHQKNPEHTLNALTAYADAHQKGSKAKALYNQAKDEKIRHIASGGVNPEAVSIEEGLQHAGGSREEDDAAPSGISQDKSAAFASGNREFVDQYMQRYDKKKGKPSDEADPYAHGDEQEQRPDVASLIGQGPQFKDASHKRAHDMLISKYYPLIEKAARRTLGKLGLTQAAESGQLDDRALHEAGIHALYQAINDYDHDHPSKASFVTHLNRKMNGLMQSALKAQDEIPAELRTGATKFKTQQRAESAAPVKHTNKEGVTTIINPSIPKPPAPSSLAMPAETPSVPKVAVAPKKRSVVEIAAGHHPSVQDRLKRVSALRPPKRDINFVAPEDGDE